MFNDVDIKEALQFYFVSDGMSKHVPYFLPYCFSYIKISSSTCIVSHKTSYRNILCEIGV